MSAACFIDSAVRLTAAKQEDAALFIFLFQHSLRQRQKKNNVQTLSTTHTSPRLQKQLRPLRFIAVWHLSRSGWWMELQVTSSLAAAQPCFSSHKCFYPAQLWCHSEIRMLNRDDRLELCSVSNSNGSSCFYNFWQCLPCLRFFPMAPEGAKQIFCRWNLADTVILGWLRDCLKRGI